MILPCQNDIPLGYNEQDTADAWLGANTMEQLATVAGALRAGEADNEQVIRLFLEAVDASDKTRGTYEKSLRQWVAFLQGSGETIMNATRRTVLAFKLHLTEGKKASTVNTYLTAVRRLYAWLEAEGAKPNIAASVKGVRQSQSSPKDALTVGQARELLGTQPAQGASLEQLRDYALVNLLARRGLRTIEAVRANIGDVRQVNGEAVLYVQGKGYADKSDFVILNEACLKPLSAYLSARGEKDPEAPLFAGVGNRNRGGRMTTRTVSRITKAAMVEHGIDAPTLTAHSLRHTAVTLALLAGTPLQEVQAMARHRSINTTMIYAHNLKRMEAGAEHAVDALLG